MSLICLLRNHSQALLFPLQKNKGMLQSGYETADEVASEKRPTSLIFVHLRNLISINLDIKTII